jgi:uncharacterized protein YqgV (UPF0045/DUF77 family)
MGDDVGGGALQLGPHGVAVVGELHAVPFEMGVPRVYTVLKLDERRDRQQTLDDKVASVQRQLADG